MNTILIKLSKKKKIGVWCHCKDEERFDWEFRLQGDTSSVQQVVHGLQVQLDQTKNRLHQTKVQYRDAKAQLDRTRTELNHFKMAFLDSERIPCGSEEPSEDKYRYYTRIALSSSVKSKI